MKTLKNKFNFVLCFVFMFALSVFALGFNCYISTFATSISDISTDVVNATFTFNGNGSATNEFEETYSATNYILEISGVAGATGYQWYYVEGDNCVLLEGKTTQTLQIRDVCQSGNYVCAVNTSSGIKVSQEVSVTINPMPASIVWVTPGNKIELDYTGESQLDSISAYFIGANSQRINVVFDISGSATLNGVTRNFVNKFIEAGGYTANVRIGSVEQNYLFSNPSKTLKIKKIDAGVNIADTTFTYTGAEQDASRCVTINNSEQVLSFENNLFTTVSEGNNREVVVKANDSWNYLGFNQTFSIVMLKATAVIDVSGVKKDYAYDGSLQKVNSGATINNTEQTLVYTNNTFTNVNDVRGPVTVFALETDNYNYVSTTFEINVDKARIDTSNWKWNYNSAFTYNVNTTRRVQVTGVPKNLVVVTYENDSAKDAGIYEAKATFTLVDSDNYYPVADFANLIWTINKQSIRRPILDNAVTTYSGKTQSLNIESSQLYTITGNSQINAGNYIVTISLNDTKNFEWNNGTNNDLNVRWTIQKAKLATPQFNLENFDGTEASLNITNESPYYIFYSDEKLILLGLNDEDNYAWQDTAKSILRIDIKTQKPFLEGPGLPIFVITLTFITLALLSAYLAFHSTIVITRHRKKIALLKVREEKKKMALLAAESIDDSSTFTSTAEQQKEIQERKEEALKEEEQKEAEKEEKPVAVVNVIGSVEMGENGKTRKPYVKSRKIASKKKVAAKKREIATKKAAAKKQAEKQKKANKKAKAKIAKSKKTTAKKPSSKN